MAILRTPSRASLAPTEFQAKKKDLERSFFLPPAYLHAGSFCSSNVLDGQLDTAAVVHVQYQHFHFLAFFQDIGHFFDASIAQHRDVNQTVLARQDVDEGAEVDDALDFTHVDLADFGFSGDAQNALTSRFSRFLGFAED